MTWFAALRKKFKEAAGEVKEARSTAKDSLALKAEVTRLDKLFAEAGVEPRKRSPLMSLRMEVIRLCKETFMRCTRNAGGCACCSVGGRRRSLEDRLAREAQASETQKETIRWQGGEVMRLHAELRRLRDQAEVVKLLSGETCRLWVVALGAAGAAKERLKARLLSASGAVLSKALFGRNGERQERPRSEHRHSRQPGVAGYGRTLRPALEERTEARNPPADAR